MRLLFYAVVLLGLAQSSLALQPLELTTCSCKFLINTFLLAIEIILMLILLAATASGYTRVNSGSSCVRVTTKAECEEAARQLGHSDTSASEETVSNYPPYCYIHGGNGLWFNNQGSSTTECSSNNDCICKGKKFGQKVCHVPRTQDGSPHLGKSLRKNIPSLEEHL